MDEAIGKPIKIILKTNIPNNHMIEFSKDNLYTPLLNDITGLSRYPFFTKAYKYDESRIKSLTYNGIVNFFFNLETFDEKIIARYGNKSTEKDIETHNIKVMLSTLFKFNKSKIQDSISIINDNSNKQNENNLDEPPTFTMENFTKTFQSMIQSNANNVVNTGDEIYMTLNNEIYKPEKIIYINDALNHPHYQKLLKGYVEFNNWLNSVDETEYIQIMYQFTFKQIEDKNQEYNDIIRQTQILEKTMLENVGEEQQQGLKEQQLIEKLAPLEKRKIILQKFIDIRKQPEYTKFYNLINEYKMDNTELKIHIKTLLEGKENTLFKFLDKMVKTKNSFKTNVLTDEINKTQTIYVLIDFIKGNNESKKMDTTNIKCSNQSEKLGNMLEDIMKGMKTSEKDTKNTDAKVLKNKAYIYSMKENKNTNVYIRDDFDINKYDVKTPILENIDVKKEEMIDDVNIRLLNKLLSENKELVKEYTFNNLDKLKSNISDILDKIRSSNKDIYNMFIHCLNGKYYEAYKFYENITDITDNYINSKHIKISSSFFLKFTNSYNGDLLLLFDLIVKIIQRNTIEKTKTQKSLLLNDIKQKSRKTGGKRRSKKRRHKRRRTKKNV